MPRPKRVIQEPPAPVVENVEFKDESRSRTLSQKKDYYVFKYVKDKEGKYSGSYYCCNCKTTLTRLVHNWNKELDVLAYGPFEKQKQQQRIIVPDIEAVKSYKP